MPVALPASVPIKSVETPSLPILAYPALVLMLFALFEVFSLRTVLPDPFVTLAMF